VLSELDGDRLPAPAGEPIAPVESKPEELRGGDVFRLIHVYADGGDLKLVSKFLSYENGRFVVRWVRMPKSALPGRPKLGDHFRLHAGKFVPVRWTPHRALAYRRLLRLRRRYAGRPAPQTPHERDAAIRERFEAMAAAGLLRKRAR
jgi:hypothetical protein